MLNKKKKKGFFGITKWHILIIVIICLFLWAYNSQDRIAKKQYMKWRTYREEEQYRVRPSDTIFVSIPSYRDPQCAWTVYDCLHKALGPHRIFIGVCQQNEQCDTFVEKEYPNLLIRRGHPQDNYESQIRILNMNASEAQGPMYARARIEQELFQGERYYFMIDSHTWFFPAWDQFLIQMLQDCPSSNPVLTMYPGNLNTRTHRMFDTNYLRLLTRTPVCDYPAASYLRFLRFNSKSDLPEIQGPNSSRPRVGETPVQSSFWAACCSFSYSTMIQHVPFDPYYPFVFFGEEISMAARLYTHGFDLFHPTFMVIRHQWSREDRHTFWEQFNQPHNPVHKQRRQLEIQGYRRLRTLFGLQVLLPGDPPLLPMYSLGTHRTLQQYEQYCGINFLSRQVTKKAKLGWTVFSDNEEMAMKDTPLDY